MSSLSLSELTGFDTDGVTVIRPQRFQESADRLGILKTEKTEKAEEG